MFRKFFVLSISVAVGLFLALSSSVLFSHSSSVSAQTPRVPSAQTNQANQIDLAFLNEAAQAGLGNIALGQLALQKSTNAQVQQFARAEIAEQQQNSADFQRIAPNLGVQLPTAPGAKFQAALTRLSQLSGTQFDNAYLDEGGVNAHLENAALFQREAAFGQNPDLLVVTNRGLPIINQHFSTASNLTSYRFAQVSRRYTGQETSVVPSTSSQQATSTTTSTTSTLSNQESANPSTSADTTTPASEDIVPQRF